MNGDGNYRRFLNGDMNAFDEIIKEYRDGLTYFIMRYTCDESIAEDIAIDVFCEILTHPKRYKFACSLKTYIYTIGRSRAIDWVRRKKRIKMLPLETAEEMADDMPSLEETVLTNERRREINKAICSLPEDMQLAVHLVYFEDLSYRDTAKVLRCSEKQVDNLLYNARKKLKNIIRKEEILL